MIRNAVQAALGVAAIGLFARVALGETWSKLGFHGGDTRLFTADGDWANGEWKAECGQGKNIIAGIATSTSESSCDFFGFCSREFTDSILCTSSTFTVNQSLGITLRFVTQDARRDTTFGDWAPGYYKGECSATEAATGLAQQPGSDGSGFMSSLRCSPIVNSRGAQNCAVRYFNGGDSRETTSRGDWDYGFYKGECGVDRYVKGIGHKTHYQFAGNGGRAAVILCCSPIF